MCSMVSSTKVYKHDPACTRQDAETYEGQLQNDGAAIAFGLMGMAEAIRMRPAWPIVCSTCNGTGVIEDWGDGPNFPCFEDCPRCSGRDRSVDR